MSRQPSLDMQRVERALAGLRRRQPRVRTAAMRRAGEGILAEAQDLAPVRTGALKSSDVTQRRGSGIAIGFSVSYAAVVHETHPDQDRFLARAIEEEGLRILGAALERALEEEGGLDG